MLFTSPIFFVFLLATFLLCALSRPKHRNFVLLIASGIFYGYWDWRFLGLIGFSILLNFFCARGIADGKDAGDRARTQRFLWWSVALNLGLLGVFKYFAFFVSSFFDLLQAIGLPASQPVIHIVLPVGISFFTFQTMSYTIDVYRGRVSPVPSILDFALYVSFFPQLVAGPIERAETFIPQVLSRNRVLGNDWAAALHLIVWGYFKKVYIADSVAVYVNRVFALSDPSGFEAALAVYAFAVQIYCDFSGYTDIARGVAKLFGFELMLNFNLPYFAKNPQEFWTRWHISLSSWLRDYLYIPLGGNRGGQLKTWRNLMLTMLLGGLWHGAAWNFVIWGFYHGLLLIVHRRLSTADLRGLGLRDIPNWLSIGVMFQFTAYGWLLFRATSWSQIVLFSSRILQPWQGFSMAEVYGLLPYAAPLAAVQLLQYRTGRLMFLDAKWGAPEVRAVIYGVMIYLCLFHGVSSQSFIYFQF